MAMPLEEKIMEEIGLGQNYRWFNGSGSCEYIRKEAARKLQGAIQKHNAAGEIIASPNSTLIGLVKTIAERGDQDRYSLTKTWQTASYVIAEHIHQAKASPAQREKAYMKLRQYIENNFLR